MVMIHLRQHIHRIRIERQVRAVHDTERIQLVPQRALPEHELRGIRTIQAVHAVRAAYPVLQRNIVPPRRAGRAGAIVSRKQSLTEADLLLFALQEMRVGLGAGMEEPRHLDRFLRDVLKIANNILRFPDHPVLATVVDAPLMDETTHSLYARDISHARYTILFPCGRNWLRYRTHCVYSSSSLDSRGTGSRRLMRFRMVIGAPYRLKRSSKWRDAAV